MCACTPGMCVICRTGMFIAAFLTVGVVLERSPAPPPVPSNWKPRFDPLVYTSKNGGGGETSMFRWTDGRLYCMHSSGVDTADCPNSGAIPPGRSFFHIRDVSTGHVVSCAAPSAGHSFFSAAMDTPRKRLWVFGSAQNRAGAKLGPCQMSNETGCYVGAWSTMDLVHFTETARAVTVPNGTMVFNTDVTVIPGHVRNKLQKRFQLSASGLPSHQAIMVLEPRYNQSLTPPALNSTFSLAINTGTDGDLTTNWELLTYPRVAAISACPSIRFDARSGYYYVVGGGKTVSITRSKDLIQWEAAKQLVAAPAALLGHAYETDVGPFYSAYWRNQSANSAQRQFLNNMTAWNWGVSDADLCCDDDDGPAYIVHLAIAQFAPKNFTGSKGPGYLAGGSSHLPLLDLLASHF
eukprot:m.76967 g.76967  ORF g.76967 m.76967 type:complete len:407 (+) comp9105_c0_seq1:396-1616(+)